MGQPVSTMPRWDVMSRNASFRQPVVTATQPSRVRGDTQPMYRSSNSYDFDVFSKVSLRRRKDSIVAYVL